MSETLNVNLPCLCGPTDKCQWPLLPGNACKIGCFGPLQAENAALRSRVAELEAQLAGARKEIWLYKKAIQEDGCIVSVGGLVTDLAALTPEAPATLPAGPETPNPQH